MRIPFLLTLTLTLAAPVHADETFTRFGDAMQILLPAAAFTCAATEGRGDDVLMGYAIQHITWDATKAALGGAAINQRPDGTGRGFPSGHSADAMFGAANLAKFCFEDRPALQLGSYALALAVGASRIDANRHTPLQVAAGLALGYFANGFTITPSDTGMTFGYSWKF